MISLVASELLKNSRIKQIYRRLEQRVGRAILDDLIKNHDVPRRFSVARFIAYALATLLYVLPLLFALLGLYLIIGGWPDWFYIVWGLVAIMLAWDVRPQFPDAPKDYLRRDQSPELFQLVDLIAAALAAPKVDGIVINPEFNSGYARAGFPPRRFLFIGLPVFTVLTNPEKIAVLAHEIAHEVNGDALRSLFIFSALYSLMVWAYIVRPTAIWLGVSGSIISLLMNLFAVPLNLALLGLSEGCILVVDMLLYLLYHDSQRAEYRADYLAATISGTSPLISSLEKMQQHQETLWSLVRRFALEERKDNLFVALQQAIAEQPIKNDTTEEVRLDSTHPPVNYRLEYLRAFPVNQPRIVPSQSVIEAFDAALAQYQSSIQEKLIDLYNSRLYSGL